MKILLLWPQDKQVPAVDKYVDYCPIKAAYMDDAVIPQLQTVLENPYIGERGKKRVLLAVIESMFYSIPYKSAQVGEVRTLRSMVKLKPQDIWDFNMEIVTDVNAYAAKVAEFAPNVIDLTSSITVAKETSDPAVDLFYYPKEVISVIENW